MISEKEYIRISNQAHVRNLKAIFDWLHPDGKCIKNDEYKQVAIFLSNWLERLSQRIKS